MANGALTVPNTADDTPAGTSVRLFPREGIGAFVSPVVRVSLFATGAGREVPRALFMSQVITSDEALSPPYAPCSIPEIICLTVSKGALYIALAHCSITHSPAC